MSRKRDYKAEYARRKARSISLGYKSPREEYKARKSLGFTRVFPSLRRSELPDFSIASITGDTDRARRKAAKEWSDAHSHTESSRYKGNMSKAQFDAYYRAFIEPYHQLGPSRRKRAKERRDRIYDYMTTYGFDVDGGQEAWKSSTRTN